MKVHEYQSEIWLPRPLDEVFEFFSDAANLERLTPPWVQFRILTPLPIAMKAGSLIDYQIRIYGFPLRWQTEITEWEPGRRFVDVQRRGPYRMWVHEHRFEQRNDGTLMHDLVRYGVPGGEIIHRLFVCRDVERIFAFRREKMLELFTATDRAIEMAG